MSKVSPYADGWDDYFDKLEPEDCPYETAHNKCLWLKGYKAAQESEYFDTGSE